MQTPVMQAILKNYSKEVDSLGRKSLQKSKSKTVHFDLGDQEKKEDIDQVFDIQPFQVEEESPREYPAKDQDRAWVQTYLDANIQESVKDKIRVRTGIIDRVQPAEPRNRTPIDKNTQIYSLETPKDTIRDALLADGLKHG